MQSYEQGVPDRNEQCPNGPLRNGEWPCLRGPRDECLTCGWAPERNWFVERVVAVFQAMVHGAGVKAW